MIKRLNKKKGQKPRKSLSILTDIFDLFDVFDLFDLLIKYYFVDKQETEVSFTAMPIGDLAF